jgi:hypothetical protein
MLQRKTFNGFNSTIEVLMKILGLLIVVSLTACATTPLAINQTAAVPETRILAPQLVAQTANTGSLVVKRDSGFMGSACTIRVFVDAVPVADLKPAERVEVFVGFGEHSVVVTTTGVLCGGGTSETAVVIMPERQRILRIAAGQSGDILLQPSAF